MSRRYETGPFAAKRERLTGLLREQIERNRAGLGYAS